MKRRRETTEIGGTVATAMKARLAKIKRRAAAAKAIGAKLPHPGEIATGERGAAERHLPHPGEAASAPTVTRRKRRAVVTGADFAGAESTTAAPDKAGD